MAKKKPAPAPVRRPGRKRGPAPKLANRADAAEILEEVRSPAANLCAIARRIGVSPNTLRAFRDEYTPKPLLEASARASRLPRPDLQVPVLERLDGCIVLAEKMLSAADAWLEDPNAPGKYNLNPRTHEVDVVYEQVIPGDPPRTARKTEKLAKLMRDVEEGLGITVVKGETRTADPRKLLLDAVDTLKPVLELLGKATGQIKPEPPAAQLNVFLGSPDWARIEETLVSALRDWPPALEAAGKALAEIGDGAPGGGRS